MPEQQSSYRQIVKSTSLFGGVQVFSILIGIIRSKFVAVLLGPAGIGIYGLLSSTTGLIAGLTNFGLGTSAVKDISAAHSTGNEERVSTIVAVFRRWVWVTGLLGALATLVLSPWLSQITFGNREYTTAFILISITLLLNQISSGQGVLLRGMRQIRYLAKAAMFGSLLGLVVDIPLFYIYGVKGIVPAIIAASIASLLLTWFYARKIKIKPITVSKEKTIAEGEGMLKMGFMISLSGLISLGASYIVRIFISNTGGVAQVGLYNAGFAIINTYVGMIFTAMSTDYYPRLAEVAHSNVLSRQAINQQAEIAILILAPIITVFLVYINWVVILLYSTKFIPVNDMILWAALGTLFKAASWPIGFLFLAKGDSKLFFWSELGSNIYLLLFNVLGYKYYGLAGLGVSYLLCFIMLLIQVNIVAKIKYEYSFNPVFYKIFGLQLLLAIACFMTNKYLGAPYKYILGTLFIVASSIHAYKELDKRLNIKSLFLSIKNRIQ